MLHLLFMPSPLPSVWECTLRATSRQWTLSTICNIISLTERKCLCMVNCGAESWLSRPSPEKNVKFSAGSVPWCPLENADLSTIQIITQVASAWSHHRSKWTTIARANWNVSLPMQQAATSLLYTCTCHNIIPCRHAKTNNPVTDLFKKTKKKLH